MLSQVSSSGTNQVLSVSVSGSNSLGGATIRLQTSSSEDGPWADANSIIDSGTTLRMDVALPLGTWVKAVLSGSSTLLDASSSPIQVLGVPMAVCTFPKTGKYNVLLKGSCTFKNISGSFPIALKSNTGSGWNTLAKATVKSLTIPMSVTPKLGGKLQIQVTSNGVVGTYASFSSNILTIAISGGPPTPKKTPSSSSSSATPSQILSRLNSKAGGGWSEDPVIDITGSNSLAVYLGGARPGCGVWVFSNAQAAASALVTGKISFPGQQWSTGADAVTGLGVIVIGSPGTSCYTQTRAALGLHGAGGLKG